MTQRNRLITLAVSAALTYAGSTRAEEQSGAIQQAQPALEEVTVTAQKRTERVQDVPKAVDVAKPEDLAQAGVSQLSDLSNLTPALQSGVTGNLPGQRSLAMRGISTLPISQNLPAQVGIVLDDVPQPTWASLANQLSDVERIEVLPGPQSTLSGRNAAAGLVNIVTRSPSFTWNGSAEVEQSNDQQTRGSVFLSGPLTDNFAFSLSGFTDRWDGNVYNAELGDKLNGYDTRGGRVKLLWRVTDNLRISANAFDQESSAATVGGQSTTGAASSGAIVYAPANAAVLSRFTTSQLTIGALEPGVTIGPDNNAYDSARHSTATAHDTGGTFRIDYDFSFATVSSLTSYASSNDTVHGDFVAIDVPVTPTDRFFHQSGISDNTVEEVRLASNGSGPFTYLAGFIYSDLDVKYNYTRAIAPADWYRTAETKSSAGYARATWQFLPDTSVTAGARIQSDKLSYSWLFRPTFAAVPTPNPNVGSASYSFPSGEASLQQKLGGHGMAYLTFSHGESGKAYDTEDNTTTQAGKQLTPLASETVNNVEVGLKTDWLERRLLLNFDVFHADYNHFPIQTVFIDPTNAAAAPVFKTLAAAKARTQGAELTVTGLPTDSLRVSLNAAYVDAKFTDFPDAPCYKLQTAAQGCVAGPNGTTVQTNLEGTPLPYSARWKANLAAEQTIPSPALPFDFKLAGFYKYQSAVQYDPLGDPYTVQGGFGTLNLTAGILGRESNWSADLYVNNVFDKHNYRSLVDSQFWTTHVVVANLSRDWERYAGIRVQARF